MKKIFCSFLFLALTACVTADTKWSELINELDKELREGILATWYPNSIDSVNGGFLVDFTYDWKPSGPQQKMIVNQTRHLWTLSEAAMFYDSEQFEEFAKHAFSFVTEKMWDSKCGGFYTIYKKNKSGEEDTDYGQKKMAYGNAFGIYALTSYYQLTKNDDALNLAKETFHWLENNSHDPVFGGYFNNLRRDGSPLRKSKVVDLPLKDQEQIEDYGKWSIKGQNTTIHLLEAFAALYRVWPDELLRTRLSELYELLTTKIVNQNGRLIPFLERDWTPIGKSDHITFGHDIETAFLLLEAYHILHGRLDEKELLFARRMVDHTLKYGWDTKNGGVYYTGKLHNGYDSLKIVDDGKGWWGQAESMNSLLLMSQLFPEDEKYWRYFLKQWEYVKKYQIDKKHGGWYKEGLDNSPEFELGPKTYSMKINYHHFRGLRNCIQMLRGEFELTKDH